MFLLNFSFEFISYKVIRYTLKDCYSHQSSPSRHCEDMLRSLLAMTLLGITSIDEWVNFLRSFPSLAIISGFLPEDIPGALTFYDFFNKLYLMDKDRPLAKGKTRFRRKPKKKKQNRSYEGVIKKLTHSSMEVMPRRVIAKDERSISSGSLAGAPWWE